ncbi:hypothetical protein [Streptomyces prunicolor]|uniref:hypothetical protein n=1 Tax=Streptomyces prunicolor TaxID=67348 RepID=UPI000377099E|nr:hypothetical protein [Streptomyces prunicolor]
MSPRPRSTPLTITAVMGPPRTEWCPRCKAYTLTCTNLHLLTPAGVTKSHAYALCEICDDPDDPEVNRG